MRSRALCLLAPLLMCASLSAHAATITSLGGLGPPGLTTFGDTFSSAGSFTDIYTFNVASSADLLDLTLAVDFSPSLNISVGLPQLFSGNPMPGSFAPVAAQTGCTNIVCTWDVVLAGNYFLEVTGNVTSAGFSLLNVPVGYAGAFVASPSPTSVSNAPLPAALPLFASGLGAMAGFAWWRKRKAAAMAAA
jgi:hypothetical protein